MLSVGLLKGLCNADTPYSMNILFSELFRKWEGYFRVCVWGRLLRAMFGGVWDGFVKVVDGKTITS